MAYRINAGSCLACGACANDCPMDAIYAAGDHYVIDEDQCVDCGSCSLTCPVEAIAPAE